MERLRQRADFLAAAAGARIAVPAFVVQVRDHRDPGPARVGFTVSKKVGNAVERNRVRRMTRTAALEVMNADYVRTARAKGLNERTVIIQHVLRNALIPVVTLIGLQAGFLLGGAVVTETIFSWPGVGRLAVGAILARDLPVAQGSILVLAVSFIVINLIVDLLYGVLDPRVSKR